MQASKLMAQVSAHLQETEIPVSVVAKKSGVCQNTVRNILEMRNQPRIDKVERVLATLGLQLQIVPRPKRGAK